MHSRQHKLHGTPLTWAWIVCPRLRSAERGLSWTGLCEQAGHAATAGACLYLLTQQMYVSLTWPKHESFLSFVRFIQTKQQFTRSLSSSLESPFSLPCIAPPFPTTFSFPLCSFSYADFVISHFGVPCSLFRTIVFLLKFWLVHGLLSLQVFFLFIHFISFFPQFLIGKHVSVRRERRFSSSKRMRSICIISTILRHMWRAAVLNL